MPPQEKPRFSRRKFLGVSFAAGLGIGFGATSFLPREENFAESATYQSFMHEAMTGLHTEGFFQSTYTENEASVILSGFAQDLIAQKKQKYLLISLFQPSITNVGVNLKNNAAQVSADVTVVSPISLPVIDKLISLPVNGVVANLNSPVLTAAKIQYNHSDAIAKRLDNYGLSDYVKKFEENPHDATLGGLKEVFKPRGVMITSYKLGFQEDVLTIGLQGHTISTSS